MCRACIDVILIGWHKQTLERERESAGASRQTEFSRAPDVVWFQVSKREDVPLMICHKSWPLWSLDSLVWKPFCEPRTRTLVTLLEPPQVLNGWIACPPSGRLRSRHIKSLVVNFSQSCQGRFAKGDLGGPATTTENR